MSYETFLLIAFYLCCDQCTCQNDSYIKRATTLYRDIFSKNYDSRIPPFDGEHPIVVDLYFHLEYLSGIDETNQIMSSAFWHSFRWWDNRLTWDPSQYQGIETFHAHPDDIWKPHIAIKNSMDSSRYILDLDKTTHLIIEHTGRVEWGPMHKTSTSCVVDTSFFPFDMQQCSIMLSTWGYPNDTLQLRQRADEFDLSLYSDNSVEWEVINIDSYLSIDDTVQYEERR